MSEGYEVEKDDNGVVIGSKGQGYTPPSAAAAALQGGTLGAGAPKRDDFPAGGAGDTAFSKATRAYVRNKQAGQSKALAASSSSPATAASTSGQ